MPVKFLLPLFLFSIQDVKKLVFRAIKHPFPNIFGLRA